MTYNSSICMLSHQEKCIICGHRVPQYFWFMLSGALCDVIQAIIDYFLYSIYTFPWERATVCWTLSYIASIFVRHSSHRVLVFGEFEGSYCYSLSRTYFTYSSTIVISMITNHIIVEILLFSHRDAWLITMLWTGLYNYFMLKASWKKPKPSTSSIELTNLWDDNYLLGKLNFFHVHGFYVFYMSGVHILVPVGVGDYDGILGFSVMHRNLAFNDHLHVIYY